MNNDEKYMAIEKRRSKTFYARLTLSLIASGTFVFLVILLFFMDVKEDARDLVNILIGAFVGVLIKTTDYWFKDKDDPEHAEADKLGKTK